MPPVLEKFTPTLLQEKMMNSVWCRINKGLVYLYNLNNNFIRVLDMEGKEVSRIFTGNSNINHNVNIIEKIVGDIK